MSKIEVTPIMIYAGEKACDAMLAADLCGIGGSRMEDELTTYEKSFVKRDTIAVEEIFKAMFEVYDEQSNIG